MDVNILLLRIAKYATENSAEAPENLEIIETILDAPHFYSIALIDVLFFNNRNWICYLFLNRILLIFLFSLLSSPRNLFFYYFPEI